MAGHLGRMADAYATEAHLAAWLHVQRADLLERKVGRSDVALGALERALQLDPDVGPVRNRLTRHAAALAYWTRLAHLLEEEAGLEKNDARAARLELDAAVVADKRLGDTARATELLERAAKRGPTASSVDRRVLDELIRLHDKAGRTADVARCRRARLRYVTDPAALAHELRWLGAAEERAGHFDAAIADVQRALAIDAGDAALSDALDRLLGAAGKNDQRIAMWVQEAARTEDPARRARVLARAARICEGLGRREDALKHYRSAWIANPGDPEVLDSLARLLAPARSEELEPRVRSLVEIYGEAAERARDPARKVAYLEKVALLWEEVLGDTSRAARAYADVLAVDGDRRASRSSASSERRPASPATAAPSPGRCSTRRGSPRTTGNGWSCGYARPGRSRRTTRPARCSFSARRSPRSPRTWPPSSCRHEQRTARPVGPRREVTATPRRPGADGAREDDDVADARRGGAHAPARAGRRPRVPRAGAGARSVAPRCRRRRWRAYWGKATMTPTKAAQGARAS